MSVNSKHSMFHLCCGTTGIRLVVVYLEVVWSGHPDHCRIRVALEVLTGPCWGLVSGGLRSPGVEGVPGRTGLAPGSCTGDSWFHNHQNTDIT